MNVRMKKGTDSYIYNIIAVDENVISVEEVKNFLGSFGLSCKDPKAVVGGKVFGLKIGDEHDEIIWFKRGNSLPVVGEDLSKSRSKRSVFDLRETCWSLSYRSLVG